MVLIQICLEGDVLQRSPFSRHVDVLLVEDGIVVTLFDGNGLARAAGTNFQLGSPERLGSVRLRGRDGDGMCACLSALGREGNPLGIAGGSPPVGSGYSHLVGVVYYRIQLY